MMDDYVIHQYTTNELVDELTKRYPEGLVVAMELLPENKSDSHADWRIYCRGKVNVTLKLANILLWEHQKDIMGGDFYDITDS